MAQCLVNMGTNPGWLLTSPPSFHLENVTYSIDTGNAFVLQIPVNFTDTISQMIAKVQAAVISDATSRFSITLAPSDVRVISYNITEGL